MKKLAVGIFAAFFWIPSADATPGATIGALATGTVAAIACDRFVRSNMAASPDSDKPGYLFWHRVWTENLAGFAAGTACAFGGAVAGAAVGLGVEATVIGSSASAVGVAAVLAARKGAIVGYKVVAPTARRALGHIRNVPQSVGRWYGQIKFGAAASSTKLRTKHMELLFAKQKGMDAVCKVPLPPLYVGPLWNRKLNPNIEIDHRLPRAKGGTDRLSNLQLTHRSYNRAKSDLTGYELRRAMARFCPVRSTS